MKSWECGVCNYIHREDDAPEKCPVCEAPKNMFAEEGKQQSQVPPEISTDTSSGGVRQWQCSVCGYLHSGTEPPEKCPICKATAEMFEDAVEEEEVAGPVTAAEKRWRCTICGYIHTGAEPPDKCPVCDAPKNMFEEIDAEGNVIGAPVVPPTAAATAAAGKGGVRIKTSLLDRFGDLVLKFHLHPITVHFPNGVLPAVVVFLALAVYLNIDMLETAAYYNLIFVLVMLPMVMFTGYIEWQKRYKGIRTAIFITKIICSLLVLASVNVLVFWRLLDPAVASKDSPYQLLYLGVAVTMLGAAGIAGHLGGKLVFGTRG